MDNVIIFGAGASYDAGIPLLSNFVESMIDIAQRNSLGGKAISPDDQKIFKRVVEIKSNLDSYLARTNFDNENLEDILSILTFNVMAGDKESKKAFDDMSSAIARTIELYCTVPDPSIASGVIPPEQPIYGKFWNALINIYEKTKKFPTIITLNYDLVLERSLIYTIRNFQSHKIPFKKLRINYRKQKLDFSLNPGYAINQNTLQSENVTILGPSNYPEQEPGIAEINILKLHGSLNFSENGILSPVSATDNPEILPPIFNKLGKTSSEPQWRFAIEALRSAKNICIVGYSLPKTDIYMQYFLKSVIGPNNSIRKIEIFDPAYDHDSEFQKRYANCFSSSMGKKLKFNSSDFKRFVNLISQQPEEAFFI